MVVGETLSEMTDKDGKAMKFGVEETATEEAKWWKSIRRVEDTVGNVEGLETVGREIVVRKKKKETKVQTRTSKVMVIEEIEDDDEDEDDLMPYPKPDSDAEDSDDDPTLINRKKDTAPVYVAHSIPVMRNHSLINPPPLQLHPRPHSLLALNRFIRPPASRPSISGFPHPAQSGIWKGTLRPCNRTHLPVYRAE